MNNDEIGSTRKEHKEGGLPYYFVRPNRLFRVVRYHNLTRWERVIKYNIL
jgi:hypothetical protein